MCRTNKTAYRTEEIAGHALDDIRKSRKKRETTPCRYYLCPFCKHYHLTSKADTHRPAYLKYYEAFKKYLL